MTVTVSILTLAGTAATDRNWTPSWAPESDRISGSPTAWTFRPQRGS